MGWLKMNEWDCAANEKRKEKEHRLKLFAWFIEDCQWGPKSEGYRGEVPSVEDLEHEWVSDHSIVTRKVEE